MTNDDFGVNPTSLTDTLIRLGHRPALLREEVSALPRDQLVVIDEVQKTPALFDELHWLTGNRRRLFVLSGLSARRARRTLNHRFFFMNLGTGITRYFDPQPAVRSGKLGVFAFIKFSQGMLSASIFFPGLGLSPAKALGAKYRRIIVPDFSSLNLASSRPFDFAQDMLCGRIFPLIRIQLPPNMSRALPNGRQGSM